MKWPGCSQLIVAANQHDARFTTEVKPNTVQEATGEINAKNPTAATTGGE